MLTLLTYTVTALGRKNKCQLYGREFWGLSSHLAIGLLLPVYGGEGEETLVVMTGASPGIL